MTRLLKFPTVLMGVALLIVTIGGMVARSEGGGARAVLIQEYAQNSRYSRLRWVVPGTSINRPVAAPFISTFRIEYQSPDRRYQYWSGALYHAGIVEVDPIALYRADLTTGKPEQITGLDYRMAFFAPNGEWIAFERNLPDFTAEIYRRRADGSEGLSLTADFPDFVRVTVNSNQLLTQTSPDSQWVYFTGTKLDAPSQIYRVPIRGGTIESITDGAEATEMEFWPAESAWPIVRRDNQLYWMRPDGGEFQPILDGQIGGNLSIMGWLPDQQILIVQGERLFGVRLGDDAPLWQVNGPYRGFFVLADWLILYGGAVARMRPDGTEFMELAGQVSSDTATLMGLSLDEPALVIFRDFPGTSGRNPQWARLADGHIQAMPVSISVPAADLLTDLDWNVPYTRQVMDIFTNTNLQPVRAPAQLMQSDFVAIGPPIDRKLHPFPLILIAGGLLAFGLAPSTRHFFSR
ncbi:MAG: hypothetical protein K8L91_28825 [Anaerolineae bacterium]|nr:hypothetical protein [Anaerolineae bacterium]